MSVSPSYTSPPLFSSVPALPGDANATSCQDWAQSHHLLFHLAHLSLGLGLLIPTTLSLHMILLRLLLITGTARAPVHTITTPQSHLRRCARP